MIKLKIGDNFLITTHEDKMMKDFIIYTMSCFTGHNKILLGFDALYHSRNNDFADYLKAVRDEQPQELFILIDLTARDRYVEEKVKIQTMLGLRTFTTQLKETLPNIKLAVVKVHNKKDSREFKIANDVYNALEANDRSILKHLSKLDEYKHFANRYKAIPGELKVINENIKQMSKVKKVCDRVITLEDLKYLNMIDTASLHNDSLIITIKPLPIYPSEPLGKCFDKRSFEKNKYLAKAAEYIYKGCHFGMVGTKIAIRPNFTPEFIETLDHKFDDMFARNNWSNVGYLHFGKGHLCGGEFNDVIAHTAEHGLEYYFMCLKQYITTANMRDYAGRKVWWYPIYDDNNNLVYCAGLDILRDSLLSQSLPNDIKEELKTLDWEGLLRWKSNHGVSFSNLQTPYNSDSVNSYSGRDDMFLEYCKEHNPDLYKELEKGANNNG